MPAMAAASVLVDVGRSLREGFFMFWETLWPLCSASVSPGPSRPS